MDWGLRFGIWIGDWGFKRREHRVCTNGNSDKGKGIEKKRRKERNALGAQKFIPTSEIAHPTSDIFMFLSTFAKQIKDHLIQI